MARGVGIYVRGPLGLIISITSNAAAVNFLKANGSWIGIIMILVGLIVAAITFRRRPKEQRVPK